MWNEWDHASNNSVTTNRHFATKISLYKRTKNSSENQSTSLHTDQGALRVKLEPDVRRSHSGVRQGWRLAYTWSAKIKSTMRRDLHFTTPVRQRCSFGYIHVATLTVNLTPRRRYSGLSAWNAPWHTDRIFNLMSASFASDSYSWGIDIR